MIHKQPVLLDTDNWEQESVNGQKKAVVKQHLPLCDPWVLKLRHLTRPEHLPARLSYHRSVVYAESGRKCTTCYLDWRTSPLVRIMYQSGSSFCFLHGFKCKVNSCTWLTGLPFICSKQLGSSLITHHPHHLLQTQVTCRHNKRLDMPHTHTHRSNLLSGFSGDRWRLVWTTWQ